MHYIIDFLNSATQETIDAYLAANGCTVIREYDHFEKTYLVECAVEPAPSDDVEHIVKDDQTEKLKLLTVDEIPTKTFTTDDDANWWKLAVLSQIDLDAPEITVKMGGQGVRCYLVDSGIAADHPEFVGKDVTLLHSVIEDDFSDGTGHGTALASVIVGETCGLTDAALKVVKIFHPGHDTLLSDLLTAFEAVLADYADGNDIAVMNLSWSIAKNAFLETKIDALIEMGLFVVTSAGNSGQAIENVTPASMPNAITVGSFGQDLTPSDFSNYTGPSDTSYTEGQTNYGSIDMFAPGEAIRVAKTDGTLGYSAGTSIAAAITSAIAVLNIQNIGLNWALGHFEDEALDLMVREITIPNLLTLEGVYADSANKIPTVNMSKLTNRTSPGAYITKGGEAFALHTLNEVFYKSAVLSDAPDWLSLNGCYLVGVAPLPEDRIQTHTATLTLVNFLDEEEVLPIYLVAHRPDLTMEEAHTDAKVSIEFANYGRPCDDYCSYMCCGCCGVKENYCMQCYHAGNGCFETAMCEGPGY